MGCVPGGSFGGCLLRPLMAPPAHTWRPMLFFSSWSRTFQVDRDRTGAEGMRPWLLCGV